MKKVLRVNVAVVLLLSVAAVAATAAGRGSDLVGVGTASGWGDLSRAARPLAGLFANATFLSYVSTNGSYHNATRANSTSLGPAWVLQTAPRADPPAGGMRALTFLHPPTRRALVAFRGTDLGASDPSAAADACADTMLWDGTPFDALPTACQHAFSRSQLDYFARAVEFAHAVANAFPSYQLAFTGHSLGAGLALMVAATAGSCAPPSAGAVVFSPPPFLNALRNRSAVNLHGGAQRSASRLITFADAYDPLLFENNVSSGLQGTVCVLGGNDPEPSSCARCFAATAASPSPGRINMSDPDCGSCFLLRHVYSHYYHDDVPSAGHAVCTARAPCAASSSACAPRGTCPATVTYSSVHLADPPDPVAPAIDFADPAVARLNGTFYAFGNDLARVAVGPPGNELSSWSAAWPFLGGKVPMWAAPGAVAGAPSAPVQLSDGRLMITFQAVPRGPCAQTVCRCIGAAFSMAKPANVRLTFTPAATPLTCAPALNGAIDGSLRWWRRVGAEDDGKSFGGDLLLLYFKTTGQNTLARPAQIWVAHVASDGSALQGNPINLLNQTEQWEARNGVGCVEAPAMQMVPGAYRLFYSGGDWTAGLDGLPYSIGFATCETPLGPCKKETTDANGGPWFGPEYKNGTSTRVVGPGSQEVFQDAAEEWWMVFHGWGEGHAGYEHGGVRAMRMHPLSSLV